MNCREVRYYLNDYADGHLIDEIRSDIESHLSICYNCKCELNDLNSILNEAKSLPRNIEPDRDLWEEINSRISGKERKRKNSLKIFAIRSGEHYESDSFSGSLKFKKPQRYFKNVMAFSGIAATIILGVLLGVLYYNSKSEEAFLAVENLAGIPKVGTEKIEKHGMLKVGEWLKTDEVSRARVKVGSIGDVEVHPGSQIKLVETNPTEYRLSLDKGKINASIWAPPRLFFVETPSATAIDLGCMYTLEVDEEGSGILKVTSGWVALESDGREALVPSDAICKTKKNYGPGTPYFEDASKEMIEALNKLDFGNGNSSDLDIVLNKARKRDAISLWHLLLRVESKDRIKTYYKLAELSPPSEDVTLEGIIDGDRMMHNSWWETLGYGSKSLWDSW